MLANKSLQMSLLISLGLVLLVQTSQAAVVRAGQYGNEIPHVDDSSSSSSSSSSSGESSSAASKEALYCYTCNDHLAACADKADKSKLKDYLTPCNGQCIKYRNPHDENRWYRGCSWEFGFLTRQDKPRTVNGTTFHFCNTHGCNADPAF